MLIADDIIDTAGTLSTLTAHLKRAGARNIFLAASHGLFTETSMDLIDQSCVAKVVVTDSLPLPAVSRRSSKVEQVSVAPLLAKVILVEHFRGINQRDEAFVSE